MYPPEPDIAFEKWSDPLNRFHGTKSEFTSQATYKDSSNDDEEQEESSLKPMVVATQFGLIPVNSSNDPSMFFNWWVGHTNFPITEKMQEALNYVLGVESVDYFSSYRFKLGVARNFDENDVLDAVANLLTPLAEDDRKGV